MLIEVDANAPLIEDEATYLSARFIARRSDTDSRLPPTA